METSLYLVSNVIRIYAISIFLDSFFGNLKCKRIIKIIAYISYYFIGSLVWIISQNTNISFLINYQYLQNLSYINTILLYQLLHQLISNVYSKTLYSL